MGNAVEIKELGGWRVFLRLCGVLFKLDLLDADANSVSVFRRNTVVAKQVEVAISRKWFYSSQCLVRSSRWLALL